ncbi:hypothetical protein LJR016_004335 [Devosia sp. LjRoot16]|uniref:hypothetical protein n=1 Tax=Devosia sp. LjRoot16 TaxID=3342271 RepID=UPI003ECCD28F
MPADDLPKPGMPAVVSPEPGVQRWTFASAEPEAQRREFRYWLGWFGLEEDAEPFEQNERFWLVKGPTD